MPWLPEKRDASFTARFLLGGILALMNPMYQGGYPFGFAASLFRTISECYIFGLEVMQQSTFWPG
jgi:hypothetical protein